MRGDEQRKIDKGKLSSDQWSVRMLLGSAEIVLAAANVTLNTVNHSCGNAANNMTILHEYICNLDSITCFHKTPDGYNCEAQIRHMQCVFEQNLVQCQVFHAILSKSICLDTPKENDKCIY